MATWQAYVDDRLMAVADDSPDHQLVSAAILGLDGAVLAKSSAFPEITKEEFDEILKEFDEPEHLALFFGGKKFQLIQGEPNLMIRAVKVHKGVCIMKTKGSLIFGISDEPLHPAQCSVIVQSLGDDLLAKGL